MTECLQDCHRYELFGEGLYPKPYNERQLCFSEINGNWIEVSRVTMTGMRMRMKSLELDGLVTPKVIPT